MKIKELWEISKKKLKKRGIENPSLEINILLSKILNIDEKNLILNFEKNLSSEQFKRFEKSLERRLNGEPISHIIGKRGFWDFEFIVNENVLDPRPDSETLIEAVLEVYKNKDERLKILDLGVGSGCLLITLLKLFPNASGVGTDISLKALDVVKKNAEKLSVQNRIKLIQSDWNKNVEEKFNIIISNPPYIPTKKIQTLQKEVRDFEPRQALDGGKDGLDCYRHLAKNVGQNLAKNGRIFLEIGKGQESDIVKIFQKNGFKLKFAKKDLGGIVRVLCFQ